MGGLMGGVRARLALPAGVHGLAKALLHCLADDGRDGCVALLRSTEQPLLLLATEGDGSFLCVQPVAQGGMGRWHSPLAVARGD